MQRMCPLSVTAFALRLLKYPRPLTHPGQEMEQTISVCLVFVTEVKISEDDNMAGDISGVLEAIQRNIRNVGRQLDQENPDKVMLEGLLKNSLDNLDRISTPTNQFAEVRATVEDLIQFVNSTTAPRLTRSADLNEIDVQGSIHNESPKGKGRPAFGITVDLIKTQLKKGFTARAVASQLKCSPSLIYKTLKSENLSVRSVKYTAISDSDLDAAVEDLHQTHPNAGNEMMSGYLRSQGLQLQRHRVRSTLNRIDPEAAAQRWSRAIVRRVYKVPVPNSLWHIDGHMRLIRWGIVTHGCIDGFSRLITFLECGADNLSKTVLNLFIGAVMRYGLPARVRSDHGGENIQVALFMNLVQNSTTSHLTGRSVHNQRIERLWRDVQEQVGNVFYQKFYMMEDSGILDINNDSHICALQMVYIPEVNKKLHSFMKGWNNHRIRTESNRTPEQIWSEGMLMGDAKIRTVETNADNLRDKLQAFGLSETDVQLNDSDRVIQRRGHVLNSQDMQRILHETSGAASLEEQYRLCVEAVDRILIPS
ncbi:uncharacterized protein [Argopecten irradians]|uniref:uncharacterized protein n=1 Tax=Argopecten irradians TaxID=31199 RepID=UPI00370FE5EC